MEMADQEFQYHQDPWRYETNALEQARFSNQTQLLDDVRGDAHFNVGLEIGCAEGLYTESIAERCTSLVVLDISPTALKRTMRRRQWSENVRFGAFDLRCEPLSGKFDLIVVAGVLEYFSRPGTFSRVRDRLAEALNPGGYLLVETTRSNPVVEGSWWGKRLIRGKWINVFMSQHPSLTVVSAVVDASYAITLCRKLR